STPGGRSAGRPCRAAGGASATRAPGPASDELARAIAHVGGAPSGDQGGVGATRPARCGSTARAAAFLAGADDGLAAPRDVEPVDDRDVALRTAVDRVALPVARVDPV